MCKLAVYKLTIYFMMNWKKALVLPFMAIALGACSSDDDGGTSASLEGKWEFSKDGVVLNGQEVFMDYEHTPGCLKDFTVFHANNQIKDYYYQYEDCEEVIDTGVWARSGDALTLTYPDDTVNATITELNATTLKLRFVDEGVTYIAVLNRVN